MCSTRPTSKRNACSHNRGRYGEQDFKDFADGNGGDFAPASWDTAHAGTKLSQRLLSEVSSFALYVNDNGGDRPKTGDLALDSISLDGARDAYEQFKRELDAYVIHWNTRRRQIRLEGHTPEEFRNVSLAAWTCILFNSVQQSGRSSIHGGPSCTIRYAQSTSPR